MKKIFSILVAVLLTANVFAQSPEKMSYQAVVRNSSDVLVVNSNIGMQISILQGSTSGTAVYVERHFPTTNDNGLVSIEIGTGTIVSGNFAAIDWANGDYFIKTETDLNGGANYTITGVSQLLSVPYALHAKAADNGITTAQSSAIAANTAKNTFPTADATKLAGIATGAEVNVQADWNQASNKVDSYIRNKPTIDGSETKVTAGNNLTVTGLGTTASPYVVGTTALTIGQHYQGGIIFWLDATGQHGLIAATADYSTVIKWGTLSKTVAFGDGIGAGKVNTPIIISNLGFGDGETYAARICNEYAVTDNGVVYGDWYLPSKYELNLLYLQKSVVGGLSDRHWSSTEDIEYSFNAAWYQNFDSGYQSSIAKGTEYYVRAIRSF